jgi:hypothetical protein
MWDPRQKDPKEYNDTELHDKLTSVLSKMNFSQRMGHSDTYHQLTTIYWALVDEQQNRISNSHITNENNFNDLIDIKK